MRAIRILAVAGVAALLAGPVAAQHAGHSTQLSASPAVRSSHQALAASEIGADFGSGWNILQIPAAAFTPGESSGVSFSTDALGYRATLGLAPSGYFVNAAVTLPAGAGIGSLGLYAFDDSATHDVSASLHLFQGRGCTFFFGLCQLPLPPSATVLVSTTSAGSPGYQYVSTSLAPLHTVDNGGHYVVRVQASPPSAPYPSGPFAFRGVDIWWKRQISPAPSTARFTDVPATAQFFAEVEALAASGITLGCTATTFCPDAPLTRRQMAAFLARALGLYWQY